jgi:hypothetical protein
VDVLRWCLVGKFRQFDDLDAKAAGELAWDSWSKVCGMRFEYTSNARTAHVLIDVGRIDGAGRVLAQAYLADGTANAKQMLFDVEEPYVIASNPPSNRVDLVAVFGHEGGHILGMGHGPSGAWMQTTYQGGLRTPQAWDIMQARARYGEPKPEPGPPPTPTDPSEGVTIFIPGAKVIETR